MNDSAPETPEQPIPAEAIRAFYVTQLEIRVDSAEVEKANAAIQDRVRAAAGRFEALFTSRGLDPAMWNVNLKTGLMTKAPKGPVAVRPAGPSDPSEADRAEGTAEDGPDASDAA